MMEIRGWSRRHKQKVSIAEECIYFLDNAGRVEGFKRWDGARAYKLIEQGAQVKMAPLTSVPLEPVAAPAETRSSPIKPFRPAPPKTIRTTKLSPVVGPIPSKTKAAPIACQHANKAPSECPCSTGCYCKTNRCKVFGGDVAMLPIAPDADEVEARLLARSRSTRASDPL